MLNQGQENNSVDQGAGYNSQDVRQSVLSKTEEMLVIMKNNEALTKEILKSVRFIKSYYFWQTIFNFLKIVILAGIIILGIVSWNTITSFLETGMKGYIGTQIPGTIDVNTINQLLR